jgi:uncharacterized glyoxalase superfamily protein PhnB
VADPALRRHRGSTSLLVEVLGFREAVVARDDQGEIVHAELRWPDGGTVLFGSAKHTDSVHGRLRPGTSAMYIPTDDVDDIHERAKRSGARILQAPNHTEFGSGAKAYAFTVNDPEGYFWTFGTYLGVQ